jgi:citrate lyase subunit beta/citryl-CoA lyase
MPAHGADHEGASMRLRSLLFVPGDRPDRMRKALTSGADALILDLEDSVVAAAKALARTHVATFLVEAPKGTVLFVRINALDQGLLDLDLGAILPQAPYGIVLPKAEGAPSLLALDAALSGTTVAILPIVTETPKAIFQIGNYGGVTDRLCGMSWGAEDLPAAIRATTSREADGRYRPPYELARSLTLFGAHAAGVAAIETVYPGIADVAGLSTYASRGRQDGFSGMMAIHPSQIAPIHAAFRPTEAEITDARKIVDLFAANPNAGALQLDGRMIDAPHHKDALRLLRDLDA